MNLLKNPKSQILNLDLRALQKEKLLKIKPPKSIQMNVILRLILTVVSQRKIMENLKKIKI